jgi:hypothetical protein
MTSEELDRKLRDLRQATERIGANLLQLELDPNRELLENSPLEGRSAEGWAVTSAALSQLWQWHGELEALLTRAEKLRETRARLRPDELVELDALLIGPSIEFAGQPVPLAERDLFGHSPATQPCTPDSLLARMSTAFEEAKTFLVGVGRAWDAYLPRLTAAQTGLAQTLERAGALGAADAERLERVGEELAALMAGLAKDPLSVRLEAVEAAEASLDAVRHDVDSLGELSREIGNRLQEGHDLLDRLRQAQRESEVAHREVMEKIDHAAVPEPLTLAPDLERQLDDVADLARKGAWPEARDALRQWTKRVGALLDETRQIGVQNHAPIEARNQLRGLLGAYRAKAGQLGLIEDPELSDLFRRAREELYSAPTDVERAAELVSRYRRALPGGPNTREVLR